MVLEFNFKLKDYFYESDYFNDHFFTAKEVGIGFVVYWITKEGDESSLFFTNEEVLESVAEKDWIIL